MTDAHNSVRDLVLDFYEAALNEHNVEKARTFLGDTYIQHNPAVADGPEGVLRFVRFLADRFPQSRNAVKMVIAEGDLVALRVHSVRVPGTPGRKIVDIFRGKTGSSLSTGTPSRTFLRRSTRRSTTTDGSSFFRQLLSPYAPARPCEGRLRAQGHEPRSRRVV